ncbi:MAG: hypothetical protein AAF226_17330, partial [Verrucomicrobiota bacterium]
ELLEQLDEIKRAEEEADRRRTSWARRDKMNAIAATIIVHVVVFFLLGLVVKSVPRDAPPSIVANAAQAEPEQVIDQTKIQRTTVATASASSSAMPNIVSASASSAFNMSDLSLDNLGTFAADAGVTFSPSMELSVATSDQSMMMFGEKMEGEVLGVVLDVSGSMAEYLPHVIREVDRNFKNAPIVYVNNALIRGSRNESEIRPIVPEQVIAHDKDGIRTPYWFLWHDLPRKAPQRYVDRLIKTFKERPNSFLAVGGDNRVGSAIDFLVTQKIDTLYIFSDYEDFVDEEIAREIGQRLGRAKVKTYVQPAEKSTEWLDIVSTKIARRSMGREMPPLVTLMRGDDEPTPFLTKKEDPMANIDATPATPRDNEIGTEFYDWKPRKDWQELHRLSEPEYDAVFYGPEAYAAIHLKDKDGKYIQHPIIFHYHSWKEDPSHPDKRFRRRTRKFLR